MRGTYLISQRVMGGLLLLLGVAMVVATLTRGGGPLALGVVLGILFTALGAGRIWILRGTRVRREP